MEFLGDLVWQLASNNISKVKEDATKFLSKKWKYLISNIHPLQWIEFAFMWFMFDIVEGGQGTLYITDPKFTALPWTVISPFLVLL